MKHIIFIALLFCTFSARAQYPTHPTKQELGRQTTGDGLTFRGSGVPVYTPTGKNNAWMYIDTTSGILYGYRGGSWQTIGGSTNIGNTDLTLTGNRRLNTGGNNLYIQDGTGVEVPYIFIGGDVVSFSASLATSVYIDSSEQKVALLGGVIDLDADSIRIIGTQPNDNSLNRLLAWDTITNRLHYVDKASIASGGVGNTIYTGNGAINENRIVYIDEERSLKFADSSDNVIFQIGVGATPYISQSVTNGTSNTAITSSASTQEIASNGTVWTNSLTVDTSGFMIAGDGLTNNNALNRILVVDSLTNRIRYLDKGSISGGGGGGITGSGTTNTIAKFTGSTAVGNSLLTDDGTNVVSGGTSSFRLPNGTTAQRPGSPLAGQTRYNTSNGALEYYGASAWESPLKSTTATGLGTDGRVFYADAAGRAAADDVLHWDAANNRLGVGTNSPAQMLHSAGGIRVDGNIIDNRNNSVLIQSAAAVTTNRDFTFGNATYGRFMASFKAASFTTGTHPALGAYLFYVNGETSTGGGAGQSIYFRAQAPSVTNNNGGDVLFDLPAGLGTGREGRVAIGNTSPQRTLHVTGEARITDLTTDAPTRIVGADADGDLGAITVGSGLVLSSSTLSTTTNVGSISVSGGSTTATAGTAERADNDTPGSATGSTIGEFTTSGSTIDYTGAAGQLRLSAVISCTSSGGGDVLFSIFKEGTEIAATEMRMSMNAVYTTIALPEVTLSASTNDTFELRVEPTSGSNTITVHRYNIYIEKLY